jgi:CHAD domain-containing protein
MAKAAAAANVKKNEPEVQHKSEFPLLDYLDKLVDDLREHVSGALKEFDVDAIHDSRVATRRLKAALDLLKPVLLKESSEPFATVLKKLRRRLGPMRDQDVMLEHLTELMEMSQYSAAAQWLSARLEEERVVEREKAAGKSTPASVLSRLGTWWGLREEVAEAKEAVGSLLAESLHLQLDAFIEQADVITRQERRHSAAPPEAEGVSKDPATHPTAPPTSAHPHDPHELRIAGKALRYTLDMAREQGHALPADLAQSFKKMQGSLGMWHDYVVLTEKAMVLSTRAMLAHHDADMQGAVLELARWTMRRATRELGAFAALWGRKGPGLAQTIRSAFPLSRSLQDAQKSDARKAAAQPPEAESTHAKKTENHKPPAPAAQPVKVEAAAVSEAKTNPDPIDSIETPPPQVAAPVIAVDV